MGGKARASPLSRAGGKDPRAAVPRFAPELFAGKLSMWERAPNAPLDYAAFGRAWAACRGSRVLRALGEPLLQALVDVYSRDSAY